MGKDIHYISVKPDPLCKVQSKVSTERERERERERAIERERERELID